MSDQRTVFSALRRQEFRNYFQPSRVVLGVLPAATTSGVNLITLCFDMYCSYKPPMMAIAVQNINASYELIRRADEFVLAVPGETLAAEALECGVRSVREIDKVQHLGLALIESETVRVPGLRQAIANIELVKRESIEAGDHVVVVGEVLRFGVNTESTERPLLSVGADTRGYEVLAERGIHRLGVVARS